MGVWRVAPDDEVPRGGAAHLQICLPPPHPPSPAVPPGEVRIYHDKSLVSLHTVAHPVTAIWFGKYGREDNTLITVTKSGALDIKVRRNLNDPGNYLAWFRH